MVANFYDVLGVDKTALVEKTALLSACGTYRYLLSLQWDDNLAALPFIMLNPSIADDMIDDPTIKRCMGFARRHGLGGIIVANLYGMRSTSLKALETAFDPVGPDNTRVLRGIIIESVEQSVPIVCAWGAGASRADGSLVRGLAKDHGARLVCFGVTVSGNPRHPLCVKGDQPFEAFS